MVPQCAPAREQTRNTGSLINSRLKHVEASELDCLQSSKLEVVSDLKGEVYQLTGKGEWGFCARTFVL